MTTGILQIATNLIIAGLSVLDSLNLPLDLLAAFAQYTGYGVWFIGGDLCLKIAASIVFWIAVKLSLGVVIFVLKLIR